MLKIWPGRKRLRPRDSSFMNSSGFGLGRLAFLSPNLLDQITACTEFDRALEATTLSETLPCPTERLERLEPVASCPPPQAPDPPVRHGTSINALPVRSGASISCAQLQSSQALLCCEGL